MVQTSDFSPLHKLSEAVKGKHKVCVFPRARLVKIGTPLGDLQMANIKCVRQFAEGNISPAKCEIERRLAGKMNAGGRNKGEF